MRIVPSTKPALPPRKVMLETLIRRLDLVRLSIGAFALVSAVGCVGNIEESPKTDPTLDQRKAAKAWEEKAYPILSAQCANGCHASDPTTGLFLQAADPTADPILGMHDAIVAFDPKVVNLEVAKASRILTKGLHNGPELSGQDASDLLEWVLLERNASPQPGEPGGGQVLASAPVTVTKCAPGALATCVPTEIDLSTVPGANLVGAKIKFKAPDVSPTMLYAVELSVEGGTSGAYIEHPLFVAVPPAGTEPDAEVVDPVADNIDRFFALKLNTNAAETLPIEGGTASFLDFPKDWQVSVHFKIITPYKMEEGGGMTGGGGGGCKDLASFKANAQTPFTQSCANCHLAGDAKMALDMAGINTADDAMILTACNQIKTRVNLTTPDQSGVFIAPDPANNNHPFKFNAGQLATFKNAVNIWINAEKVAP